MKKFILYILAVLAGSSLFIACEEQNEMEARVVQTVPEKPEAYYENLRAYRNTDHYIAFGWFGNWSAAGPAMSTRLANVPDSMDIISIWGDYNKITPEMKADMEYVRRVKGMKVIFTILHILFRKNLKLLKKELKPMRLQYVILLINMIMMAWIWTMNRDLAEWDRWFQVLDTWTIWRFL